MPRQASVGTATAPILSSVLTLLIAFGISVLITGLIVRSAGLHAHRSADRDFSQPQKFHAVPVPRIGGIAVVAGLLGAIAVLLVHWRNEQLHAALLLTACAIPAFLAGLWQDMTDAIAPRGRLMATALSAALSFYLLDTGLDHTGIPGLDWVVGFAAGSLLVTVLAVAGVANAINIIDGFNGLASMCIMLMLSAVAYVAFQVDDTLVGTLALAGIGAVLGFFLWNFPSGLVFLGDGGAYFLGFFLAELLLLLLHRNPGEVSPIFALLVCVYPIFETLFSIYRRVFLRSGSPSVPDGLHLHSLMYRRLLRWAMGDRSARSITRSNAMTSPLLWALCSLSLAPAVLFWDDSLLMSGFLLLFAVTYLGLYWRIVRFRSPRWLRRWRPNRASPLRR